MAKDKESIDDQPWYIKERQMRQMGEDLGVDYNDYRSGGRGTGWSDQENYQRFEDDVIAAGKDNYSMRRSIEAAKLSGYKGAEDLDNGLNSLQSIQDANDFMKGIHENELGHTGKFSSINDRANVANFFVNHDRNQFRDEMQKSFSNYIEENQPEAADTANQQAKAIEFSPELQAAHARINEYEKGTNSTNGVYDKSLDGETPSITGEGGDQRDQAAQNFADAYKLELSTKIKQNR